MRNMKKLLVGVCAALVLTGCANEFNRVYKTQDYNYKYEYAKECFANGKYVKAITLLEELVTMTKAPTMVRSVFICCLWRSSAMLIMKLPPWALRSIFRVTPKDGSPRWLLTMLEKVFI